MIPDTATAELPTDYLARVGRVFARFGADTQDSGNVSYGVEIDGARYFVKTAGDPSDTTPYLRYDTGGHRGSRQGRTPLDSHKGARWTAYGLRWE